MTDKITYWVASGYDANDPYADQSWSSPVTLSCEYMTGGSMQRDNDGTDFQPRSTIYSVESIPFAARVVFGVSTELEPPSSAEIVRRTGFGTALRGQRTEFEAFTG